MDINNLPDIVLTRIIYWTCNEERWTAWGPSTVKEWKPKLTILAICKRWRALGLPCVHAVSFINITRYPSHGRRNDHPSRCGYLSDNSDYSDGQELSDFSNDNYSVKSNFDIIENTIGKCWPKELEISMKAPYDPIYGLCCLHEKLRFYKHLLSRVRIIELTFNLGFESSTLNSDQYFVPEVRSMCRDIAELIPSVGVIKLLGVNDAPVTLEFAKSIAKNCAPRLTAISCPQNALERVNSFSDKLEKFEINGHRCYSAHLPQICAENLVVLDLEYIQRNFNWSSFRSEHDSYALNFNCLRRLRVRTETELTTINEGNRSWGHSAREFNHQIIAPKLERITIILCPYTLSLLSSIQGIAIVRNVELEMNKAHLYFTNLNLNIARDRFSHYAKESQNEVQAINFYAYMNDIFGIPNLAEYTKARVGFNDYLLDIEQVKWTYLMDIELYCQIHVNNLRQLLTRLPNLESAYIDKLDIQKNENDVAELLNRDYVTEPMRTKITKFSFGDWYGYTEEENKNILCFISKLIPSE